jgi:hypothetical protein
MKIQFPVIVVLAWLLIGLPGLMFGDILVKGFSILLVCLVISCAGLYYVAKETGEAIEKGIERGFKKYAEDMEKILDDEIRKLNGN